MQPTQRLFLSQTVTSDASGNGTFTFQAPPTSLVYTGTLVCLTAPGAATFTGTVGGDSWCSWAGQSIGGPVQAWPGQIVKVTVTGLTATTTFQLRWIGKSSDINNTEYLYPDTNTVSTPSGSFTTVVLPTSATPGFGQAKVASGGTAVQLSATSIPVLQGVAVQALKSNVDQIYLGITGVTTTHDGTGNGWELQPGQCSPVIPVSNVNLLYINSATTGSGVVWTGV